MLISQLACPQRQGSGFARICKQEEGITRKIVHNERSSWFQLQKPWTPYFPSSLIAATEMMISWSRLAGNVRSKKSPSLFAPSLPAAKTASTPACSALSSATDSDLEIAMGAPHELDVSSAPMSHAYSKHLTASETDPVRSLPVNLQGRILTLGAIPWNSGFAFGAAAMMPATWLPWPLKSIVSLLLSWKFQPLMSSMKPRTQRNWHCYNQACHVRVSLHISLSNRANCWMYCNCV